MTYSIVRFYQDSKLENVIIERGLSLEEVQSHCEDPETSWRTCHKSAGKLRTLECGPWFDGYVEESDE